MKINYFSDIHLEFGWLEFPHTDADVVVAAGDIGIGAEAVNWLARAPQPVLYIAGNHEYYGGDLNKTKEEIRSACVGTNVTFLECEQQVIGDVRFIATTLWTDFAVAGDRRGAMHIAQRFMPDYRAIQASQGEPFTPQRALELHHRNLAWLQAQVGKSQAFTNIVISHHAPSPRSIAARYRGNLLNPAFITDLEGMIAGNNIALWVHGHTHTAFDYTLRGTRVGRNPRGYLPYETDTGFDSGKIIALGETDHEPAPGAS